MSGELKDMTTLGKLRRVSAMAARDDYYTSIAKWLLDEAADRIQALEGEVERLTEAADKLVNQFAWSAVRADCTEANVYLTQLINDVRSALSRLRGDGGCSPGSVTNADARTPESARTGQVKP